MLTAFNDPDLPKMVITGDEAWVVWLAHLILFFTQNLIQFLWIIISNSKKSKNTPKHEYLSKTSWQSKMADIVNIYNRPVYSHNRQKKCENRTLTHEIWKQRLLFNHTSYVCMHACKANTEQKKVSSSKYCRTLNFKRKIKKKRNNQGTQCSRWRWLLNKPKSRFKRW